MILPKVIIGQCVAAYTRAVHGVVMEQYGAVRGYVAEVRPHFTVMTACILSGFSAYRRSPL